MSRVRLAVSTIAHGFWELLVRSKTAPSCVRTWGCMVRRPVEVIATTRPFLPQIHQRGSQGLGSYDSTLHTPRLRGLVAYQREYNKIVHEPTHPL